MKTKALTLVTIVAITLAITVTLVGAMTAQKAPSPGLDLIPASVESVTFQDRGRQEIYLVRLSDAPIATYNGGINNLAATSVEGEGKLDTSNPEVVAYRTYLSAKQDSTLRQIEQTFNRSLDVVYRYYTANNGFAVYLTAKEAEQLRNMPGVLYVQKDEERELMTDNGPVWIGADTLWDGSQTGGAPGTEGEGIIIGVIDTGINPSNPSFADVGMDGYDHTNPWGAGTYVGVCDPADPTYDAAFPCNDKLIGARGYADVNGGDPRDNDGHGSHTASTAGGNYVYTATVQAPTMTITRSISGVAPHANIVAYAACCTVSALTAAIDDAINDGVDVINYSIGSSSPSDVWNDFDTVGFLNARAAGIFVATSAGNSGPEAETVGSPADAPWLTAVGASTHDRKLLNSLINMTGDGTPPSDMEGKSITAGYGPAPIVHASSFGDALCLNPFPAGTWTNGEIVVCDRGTNGRVEKGQNVLAGGAGGYVLANVDAQGEGINADPHALPAVHIGDTNGDVLRTWLASGTVHTATIAGTIMDINPANGDIMASFSSRGANRALPDIIAPSVTAPGVDIIAAYGTNDSVEWNAISGTSMSSPHVAGAAALVKALHPDWSPAEIQSALMTTAWTDVLDTDGITPANPFDMGSGRVDLSAAARAGLVLDETHANYLAADPASGGDPKTLNLASIGNASCLGNCSWTRTVTSTLAASETWTITAASLMSATLTVTPTTFTLPPGGQQTITITAGVTGTTTAQWLFGSFVITPSVGSSAPPARLPVAVKTTNGVLCSDKIDIETRRDAGSVLCAGNETIEVTNLTINAYGLTAGTERTDSLVEDPTNSDPYDAITGTVYVTVTVPSGAKRLVAQTTQSTANDLDLFIGTGDTPSAATRVCGSTTATAIEYCDVTDPDAGTWWILVQNWDASATPPDQVIWNYAIVPGTDAGNMTVQGSTSVPELTPYDLRVFWNESAMSAGQYWYGAFDIGSSSGSPGDIGTLPVDLIRINDDIVKAVTSTVAYPGETVTYTITVQPNVMAEDMTYMLSDTIPAGLTYVPGSLSASSGSANITGNIITWTGIMTSPTNVAGSYAMSTNATDANCRMPIAGNSYLDLATFGLTPSSSITGDTVVYSAFSTEQFEFYDISNTGLNFTDDGFVFFNSTAGSTPWINTDLPDPNDPNDILAMLWADGEIFYDAANNYGVTIASLTSSGGAFEAAVIEYDDIQPWGGGTPFGDFEVVVYGAIDNAPGAYEIRFAYDNLQTLPVSATIGVENQTGTAATKYLFGDPSILSNNLIVCFDYTAPVLNPVTITYQATVDTGASPLLTNTVLHNTSNSGSQEASASATVTVPHIYFPIIMKP